MLQREAQTRSSGRCALRRVEACWCTGRPVRPKHSPPSRQCQATCPRDPARSGVQHGGCARTPLRRPAFLAARNGPDERPTPPAPKRPAPAGWPRPQATVCTPSPGRPAGSARTRHRPQGGVSRAGAWWPSRDRYRNTPPGQQRRTSDPGSPELCPPPLPSSRRRRRHLSRADPQPRWPSTGRGDTAVSSTPSLPSGNMS